MADADWYEEPQRQASGADTFSYTPLRLVRGKVGSYRQSEVASVLDRYGLDESWLGEQGNSVLSRIRERIASSDLSADFLEERTFRRYQYDVIYIYARRKDDGDNEYFPIEFRTWINTIDGIAGGFKQRMRLADNPRLQTLFDSGPYEGFMSGFEPVARETFEEDNAQIAAKEAANLGIPQFEVLLHMDGDVVGHAGGFYDPFEAGTYEPGDEVWNITENTARRSYEFRPQGNALQRLIGTSKQVFLNGKYIGNIGAARGTVYLKKNYDTKDGTYKDSRTGKQMWSRQKLVNETPMSYQAIAEGGKVYKVAEQDGKIFLTATKPGDDFEPADPDRINPEIALRYSDTVTFNVRFDEGGMMGKYDNNSVHRVADDRGLYITV